MFFILPILFSTNLLQSWRDNSTIKVSQFQSLCWTMLVKIGIYQEVES